jgi:uncharacterized protein YaiL (DUF2058 family)
MGSLQDQLLQSGLVSADQLKQTSTDSRKQRKRKPKQAKSARKQAHGSDASRAADAAASARRSRDRELNQVRNAERDRKARLAQLRTFLDEHRLNDGEGDIKHFYQSGRKVKQIWVTSAQQQQLADGKLLVAVLEGRGHLLKRELEDRLVKIDPDQQHLRIVVVDPSAKAEEEAYADHPIPDDLMW